MPSKVVLSSIRLESPSASSADPKNRSPETGDEALPGTDGFAPFESLLHVLSSTGMANNTRKNYAAQWRMFASWALRNGSKPFPADPTEVAVYLAERLERRGHRPATLRAAAAAISYVHRTEKIPAPIRPSGRLSAARRGRPDRFNARRKRSR